MVEIRLLPPAPTPTVLFTLNAPGGKNNVTIPNAYVQTLHSLSYHSLEQPRELCALDCAFWALGLLEQVVFDCGDLREGTKVGLVWVDGWTEWWVVPHRRLGDMLSRVVDCVRESEAAAAPERRGRQKSLVRNLVHSVLHTPPASPPVTSSTSDALQNNNNNNAARYHRRKARSVLLDALRMYVISPLGARFRAPHSSGGGASAPYTEWIVRSMLRRCVALQAQSPPEEDTSSESTESEESVRTPRDEEPLPLPSPNPCSPSTPPDLQDMRERLEGLLNAIEWHKISAANAWEGRRGKGLGATGVKSRLSIVQTEAEEEEEREDAFEFGLDLSTTPTPIDVEPPFKQFQMQTQVQTGFSPLSRAVMLRCAYARVPPTVLSPSTSPEPCEGDASFNNTEEDEEEDDPFEDATLGGVSMSFIPTDVVGLGKMDVEGDIEDGWRRMEVEC